MKIISEEEAMNSWGEEEEGYRIYSITRESIPNLDGPVYCLIADEELQELRWSGMVEWVKKELFPHLYRTHFTPSDMKKGILEERQGTHGDFTNVAAFSQTMKAFCREQMYWSCLSCEQRESIDNIIQKMARVFAGDPNFADHWTDIAGYATLSERFCIRKGENQDEPTSPK